MSKFFAKKSEKSLIYDKFYEKVLTFVSTYYAESVSLFSIVELRNFEKQ